MKQLFLDIEAKLKSDLPNIKFINPWNNQVDLIQDGKIYSFPLPAIFIGFAAPSEIKQLGNGNQIYDPLVIEVHIVQEFYHDAENMERNLDIFDLRTLVYQTLQNFEPDGCVQFIRFEEEQDVNHTNVYHFIQRYRTNYVDSTLNQPVNGIDTTPPTTPVITIDSVDTIS